MRLDRIKLINTTDRGSAKRVGDRLVHMWHDQCRIAVAVELLLKAKPNGAVSPSGDASPWRASPGGEPAIRNQDERSGAVGDLGDVVATQTTGDDGVHVVVGAAGVSAQLPGPSLGIGVPLGITQVEFTDRTQVHVVEAIPTVVFVGESVEGFGPDVGSTFGILANPCRSFLHGGGFGPRHGLFLLDTKHEHAVIPAALDLGHRTEHRHRRRRACGFVAHGGHAPQFGDHRCRHCSQVALAGVELAEGVADMDGVDVAQINLRVGSGRQHGVANQRLDRTTRLGQVVGKVTLVSAQDAH